MGINISVPEIQLNTWSFPPGRYGVRKRLMFLRILHSPLPSSLLLLLYCQASRSRSSHFLALNRPQSDRQTDVPRKRLSCSLNRTRGFLRLARLLSTIRAVQGGAPVLVECSSFKGTDVKQSFPGWKRQPVYIQTRKAVVR
jgi:hypothetical protein